MTADEKEPPVLDTLTTEELEALVHLANLGLRYVCGRSACGEGECKRYRPAAILTERIRKRFTSRP